MKLGGAKLVLYGRTQVNPALVLHVSIGQSTVASRQALANLFYRGVVPAPGLSAALPLRTTAPPRGASSREAASMPRLMRSSERAIRSAPASVATKDSAILLRHFSECCTPAVCSLKARMCSHWAQPSVVPCCFSIFMVIFSLAGKDGWAGWAG